MRFVEIQVSHRRSAIRSVLSALPAALAAAVVTWPAAAADPAGPGRLVTAYPAALSRIEGNELLWSDGTRMPIDDGRGAKSFDDRLAAPDIKDMFEQPYPVGDVGSPPAVDSDPGRARNQAFFDKLYGDCRKGDVVQHLVDVVWLPRKSGQRLQITRVAGVAERLEAVSRALDELPARFDRYLLPSAGTYNCRPIAGTTRISAHGHGIAIDIAVAASHYWRWTRPDAAGRYPYRNAVPIEIVRIFEANGFIWGGKWYHYDTMHFEYRPELLPPLAPHGPR